MKPNCSRIIVTAFNLEDKLFAPYYQEFIDKLRLNFPGLSLE